MSFRVWADPSPKPEWADFGLLESGSLEKLTDDAAWKLPSRITSKDPLTLWQFLQLLETRQSMPPTEHWDIALLDTNGKQLIRLTHPTWREVEDALRPYYIEAIERSNAALRLGTEAS